MPKAKHYKHRPKEEWLSTHVSVGLNTDDTQRLREACIATETNGVQVFRLALRYFVAHGCPTENIDPLVEKPNPGA